MANTYTSSTFLGARSPMFAVTIIQAIALASVLLYERKDSILQVMIV